MKKYLYMNDIGIYVEHVLLPELLTFVIMRMYVNNVPFNHSFYYYYSYYKSLFNVRNINYYIVLLITKNILLKRYNLLTKSFNPLIITKIKES